MKQQLSKTLKKHLATVQQCSPLLHRQVPLIFLQKSNNMCRCIHIYVHAPCCQFMKLRIHRKVRCRNSYACKSWKSFNSSDGIPPGNITSFESLCIFPIKCSVVEAVYNGPCCFFPLAFLSLSCPLMHCLNLLHLKPCRAATMHLTPLQWCFCYLGLDSEGS